MNIELLYFAQMKERFGLDRESIEIDAGETVGGVFEQLTHRTPDGIWAMPITFAVNERVVNQQHELKDGDRLALLTPVSGG